MPDNDFEFDFDKVVDRRRTNAMAVNGYDGYLFGDDEPVSFPCPIEEVISMWVADMAFESCPAAIDGIAERLEHRVFGYSAVFEDDLYNAFVEWCESHYGWRPTQEHLVTATGVVPALQDFVEYVLEEDECVMTLTPSYGMFAKTAEHHGRELVHVAMAKNETGVYDIDFDAFEATAQRREVKMFFLCHPQNPTGRVWSDDELTRMTEICLANDVLVISDEIHCDLLRTGLAHTPLAKLFPESDRIVTCMSVSKTFNLAGLGLAMIVIPNDELRTVWRDRTSPLVNPLSLAAAVGVLRNGEPWRLALLAYLDESFSALSGFLATELPDARFVVPDATYLAWVDLGSYVRPDVNLTRYFAETVGVLIEGDDMFVADGAGHIRINLACPQSTLLEGLGRLAPAARALRG